MKRTLKITGMLLIVAVMACLASCGGVNGSTGTVATETSQKYDIPNYTPEELTKEMYNCFKTEDWEKYTSLFVSAYEVLSDDSFTDDVKKRSLSDGKEIFKNQMGDIAKEIVSLEFVDVERIDDSYSRMRTKMQFKDGSEGEVCYRIKKVKHGWRIDKVIN